jgi:hypothetical protein
VTTVYLRDCPGRVDPDGAAADCIGSTTPLGPRSNVTTSETGSHGRASTFPPRVSLTTPPCLPFLIAHTTCSKRGQARRLHPAMTRSFAPSASRSIPSPLERDHSCCIPCRPYRMPCWRCDICASWAWCARDRLLGTWTSCIASHHIGTRSVMGLGTRLYCICMASDLGCSRMPGRSRRYCSNCPITL